MRIEEEEEDEEEDRSRARFEHKIDIRNSEDIQEISSDSRETSEHELLIANPRTNASQRSSSSASNTFASARFIFILFRYVGLDLYLPNNLETPRPVVAFVCGGAWTIGYKAWGSILALQLVEEDVIVACIDYRNFPQGTISVMVEDVSQGISFICNNIANYGGDLERLYLVGQSAGAHLGACTLLSQVRKECEGSMVDSSSQVYGENETFLPWRASQFKAYIGISGCYDLYKLANHFDDKGINRTLFLRIMEGEESLTQYSPELCLQNLVGSVGSLLPSIYLLHGTDDHSIPCNASTSFVETLRSAGVEATMRLYEGKSHTDLFLQDPMRGGHNALLEDILMFLDLGEGKDASTRLQRRMVPECLLWLAHRVSPF